MTITERPQDPRTQYPEPPFPKQQQEPPGTEAELEPKAVFLASQESSYITGEVIGVTGGRPLG